LRISWPREIKLASACRWTVRENLGFLSDTTYKNHGMRERLTPYLSVKEIKMRWEVGAQYSSLLRM
jgi:hypothetical protein